MFVKNNTFNAWNSNPNSCKKRSGYGGWKRPSVPMGKNKKGDHEGEKGDHEGRPNVNHLKNTYMKKVMTVFFSLIFFAWGIGISTAQQTDVKGSKDHPLLTRMPDFWISDYKEADFESFKFIGADAKPVIIEGHKYYIGYKLNAGVAEPGELKIRRNVQDALKKIGGKVVFDDNFNRVSTIVIQKDGKETWIQVSTFNNWYRLNIVEREIMEQEVIANADAMGDDIHTTGHVAVYGIHFETGKAEINPESADAIAQIALLLQNETALKLYIVGHTDNVGSMDSNMKLSKDRADAVVNSLITQHGISAERLKSYGVSSLSPVATNDTEEGRAKNRRVELVKQ
jgi:outer membrane protein OmpA-like peptidoglycan-associated protein